MALENKDIDYVSSKSSFSICMVAMDSLHHAESLLLASKSSILWCNHFPMKAWIAFPPRSRAHKFWFSLFDLRALLINLAKGDDDKYRGKQGERSFSESARYESLRSMMLYIVSGPHCMRSICFASRMKDFNDTTGLSFRTKKKISVVKTSVWKTFLGRQRLEWPKAKRRKCFRDRAWICHVISEYNPSKAEGVILNKISLLKHNS